MRALALAALLALPIAAWSAADPVLPQPPQLRFVPPAPGSYRLQVIQRVPDAVLVDGSHRARSLRELTRTRVTLLTFFYTYCTDAWGCPYAYAVMTGLRERLLARPDIDGKVRFVSISFDPTNDTPEALRRYATATAADARVPWELLTARSMAQLLPLLDDFGQDVRVERDEAGRPLRTINHMLKLFLIDGEGRVREIYALDFLHPDMMLNDIDTLLMEAAERGRGSPRQAAP
jgi:cytochrome oxidase Cu insertion factor (SCO1/SenC/PrrC family)